MTPRNANIARECGRPDDAGAITPISAFQMESRMEEGGGGRERSTSDISGSRRLLRLKKKKKKKKKKNTGRSSENSKTESSIRLSDSPRVQRSQRPPACGDARFFVYGCKSSRVLLYVLFRFVSRDATRGKMRRYEKKRFYAVRYTALAWRGK